MRARLMMCTSENSIENMTTDTQFFGSLSLPQDDSSSRGGAQSGFLRAPFVRLRGHNAARDRLPHSEWGLGTPADMQRMSLGCHWTGLRNGHLLCTASVCRSGP